MTGILIVPFENLGRILREIETTLSTTFNQPVKITTPQKLETARRRGTQFHAEDFLPIIIARVRDYRASSGLGITTLDLFVPELNFVFGLATREHRVAIISLARLSSANWKVFLSRCIKEAIHELGHASYGLSHCPNPTCVMFFSNSLVDTDVKGVDFCKQCSKKIRPYLQ